MDRQNHETVKIREIVQNREFVQRVKIVEGASKCDMQQNKTSR